MFSASLKENAGRLSLHLRDIERDCAVRAENSHDTLKINNPVVNNCSLRLLQSLLRSAPQPLLHTVIFLNDIQQMCVDNFVCLLVDLF